MPDARQVEMGVIGRPHGVRGLVRVTSYASDPVVLARHALHDDRGRTWRLAWCGDGIAALTDAAGRTIGDRNEAASLTNRRLFVARADLPDPDPDEFYLADLIGLQAVDRSGEAIGRVAATHDYGAGLSLEIEGTTSLLVPFTQASVPAIDLQAGRLTVVPPEAVA